MALAYVPTYDVVISFEELIVSSFFVNNEDSLEPLFEYFEDNLIGWLCNNKTRTNPKVGFINLSKCYEITLNDLFNTNNSVEGWHQKGHRFIWKFIEIYEFKIEQYVSGSVPPPSRICCRKTAVNIKRTVDSHVRDANFDINSDSFQKYRAS